MQPAIPNRKGKKILAVAVFGLLFSALLYFGYQNFFKKENKPAAAPNGLNSKLPEADKPKEMNKLEIYMQAEKDSIARKAQQANDPYAVPTGANSKMGGSQEGKNFGLPPATAERNSISGNQQHSFSRNGPTVKNIGFPQFNLGSEYNRSAQQEDKIPEQFGKTPNPNAEPGKKDPKLTSASATDTDPELKQLEGMLDKLIEIQHPDRSKEPNVQLDTLPNQKRVVSTVPGQTIQAVVHNTQIVSSGATLKLRLLQDILVGTSRVSKGSFLYGICSVNNERLTVRLTNINSNNQVIPVSLSVFDMDGVEGIYVPGTISRDVSKDGADQAIQSFNLNNLSGSLAGQAASAGIQATKALLSKKVKLIRVTVKAGHHVLLQNAHSF